MKRENAIQFSVALVLQAQRELSRFYRLAEFQTRNDWSWDTWMNEA